MKAGILLSGVILSLASAGAWADYPVAGVKPHQRPENAPTLDKVQHPEGWKQEMMKGVAKPHDNLLDFVDDQGSWYTPFPHRNAPGPYDIRNLYEDRSG